MDISVILICVVVGLVAAFLVTGVMKGQLQSVRSQSGAGSYVRQGSMVVTAKQDLFLYRNVHRRPKPQNNKK